MQPLKISGLILLVAVAVIYAGMKAYVYFSVKEQLDRAVMQMRPFAALGYGGISSNLGSGTLTVHDIEIDAGEQSPALRIGLLDVAGPGPFFLFDLASGLSGEELPAWMRLDVRRLDLPDPRDLLPLAIASSLPVATPPPPCSLAGLLGRAGLFNSDRFPLTLDASMRYELNAPMRLGRVEFQYQIVDGESVMLEVALSNLPQLGAVMLSASPGIERVSYAYQPDVERLREWVGQCASDAGQNAAEFATAALAQPEEVLLEQLGFIPGPGLAAALQSFLLAPGEILIVAGPLEEISQFQQAALTTPERWVELLNLRVSLNGKRLQDLSFRSQAMVEAQRQAANAAQGQAPAGDASVRPRPAYLPTPVTQLHRYLGRNVHLSERGRAQPHIGVLVSVQDDEASVEKRVHGGTLTVHVPFQDISQIDVWRYVDPIE
jgi:hypothetical protein